jgi:cytoskeletal protein CcmA (bactofilin family)/RNase P subunit RPR2
VLGKFLGRDQKSSLPKNQIEVVCPLCGSAQREPSLVVTTICRKCGEHLRIEKRKAIASSQINPVPSAVYPAQNIETKQELADGAVLKDIAASVTPVPKEADVAPAPVDQASPAEVLISPAPTSRIPATSTLQKMLEKGHNQQYFKEAECFDCHHKFKVGRAAKSTNCPACGIPICLEDFDINLASSHPIITRGDVMIRKTGNVSTSEIKCKDLRVFGQVSAEIECSGSLIMRSSGTVVGEIHCHKFIVEKTSDLHFLNTIHADEVEIQARVVGNIECNGLLLITATGLVHGDVAARSISIEPGGQLDGSMNILRSSQKPVASPQQNL